MGLHNARLPRLPGAPPELQALIERCTAPEAGARPSFAEVHAQLAALQAAAPAAGARSSSSGPLRISTRRPRSAYAPSAEARSTRCMPGTPVQGREEPGSASSNDASYWRRWGVLRDA